MPVVSLEQDRRYRHDGTRYVETCVACGRDRDGDAEACACGTAFAKPTSNFWKLRWTPTAVRPQMPDTCPHCDGPTERLRSIALALPTSRSARERITIELGTCRRVPPPFLMWLAFLTSVVLAVMGGFAVLFGHLGGLVPLAITNAGMILAWRIYGWVRFAGFDHRSVRLRVRRPSYARAVADRNGGRVL